jgi:PAS domain S-box-containing protein
VPETTGAARSDAARVHPRELVALLALPLLWREKQPGQIAHGLVEFVDSQLQPDCVYVRMSAEGEPALVERLPAGWAFTAAMARELEPSTSAASGGEWSAGGSGVRIARAQQSFPGEHCVAVATSRRPDFPLPSDLFVLQRAVDQAVIAFHGARLLAREQAARSRAEMHADQMSLVSAVAAAVAGATDLPRMLDRCAKSIVRHLHPDFAGIWTLQPGEQELHLRADAGSVSPDPKHRRVPLASLPIGAVARDRSPQRSNDPEESGVFRDWAARSDLVAFAGYPLTVAGECVGVLGIFARSPLRTEALDSLRLTADAIATGIQRKQGEQERSQLAWMEEQARAETEAERAQLRSFFLQAPVPIAVLRGPDHVCELANPPFCEMVGRYDLVGKSVRALFSEGSEGPPLDRAFQRGEPIIAPEYPVTRNRGGTADTAIFKLVLDPYRDASGAVQGLTVGAVDVTDEVMASRRMQARVTGLADERQWLETLLDLLPVPVLLVETATTRVAFSNKAADRMAGGTYPRSALGGEAEGYSYTDADGRPVPKQRHPAARAARGEGLRGLELDWHTPSGTRSLLLSSALLQAAHGHPATAMLAFEDVSELKHTQSALRAALAESSKFVSVSEESSDFIGIASLDLEVQFVNRSGQALVGLDGPGRVRRTTIPDYLFPEDHAKLVDLLTKVRATGRQGQELRFKHFRTGQEVPVWCNVFLLRDRRTTEPIAYTAVAHDLTEQKRNWELRERVLGIIGHDLLNPLSAILMAASTLRDDPSLLSPARVASRILSSAHRIESIISDLLDLSQARLGGGIAITRAPTDAHALCRRILEELQAVNPGREIRFTPEGDADGRWDADRLEQVVSNLVSNALQYGPPDAAVNVDSRGTATDWTFSVHNSGDPIPTDVLPHIFDPFKRGRPEAEVSRGRRNLGLGLFIARELVLAHQGTIEVTSTAGQGTWFVVRLPRAA